MRFFTKLLVDNLLIVSGDCFNWFLGWFLNLLVQSMCFAFHPFTDLQSIHFLAKHSNHLSIEIEMLYIYFLCLTIETIFEWRCPSSFPTFRAFCYLHSFESWLWVLLCRCLPYRGFTLKTFINSDAFYDFATVNGNPSAVATRQFFPFHACRTSVPF